MAKRPLTPAQRRRQVTRLVVYLVASVCGVTSYIHAHDVVARAFGEHGVGLALSWAVPSTVDGAGIVGSARLVADKAAGRAVSWAAVVTAGGGLLASIACNLVAVVPELASDTQVKVAVALYPPITLGFLVHLMLEDTADDDASEPHAPARAAEPRIVATAAGPASTGTAPAGLPVPTPALASPAPADDVVPAVALAGPQGRGPDRAPVAPRATGPGPEDRQDRGPGPVPDHPVRTAAPDRGARPGPGPEGRQAGAPAPGDDDLDPILVRRAEAVWDQLQQAGVSPSRRKLMAGMAADSYPRGVGTATADALLKHLERRQLASTNGRSHNP